MSSRIYHLLSIKNSAGIGVVLFDRSSNVDMVGRRLMR